LPPEKRSKSSANVKCELESLTPWMEVESLDLLQVGKPSLKDIQFKEIWGKRVSLPQALLGFKWPLDFSIK